MQQALPNKNRSLSQLRAKHPGAFEIRANRYIDFADRGITEAIEARLLASLAATNQQTSNEAATVAVRDDQGELIAGGFGSTSYGWLLIKTLWVTEDYRGIGLGREIMEVLEDWGRKHCCHAAWLDTSNEQAKTFYVRHGYEIFAELANSPDHNPPMHRRWFMKKDL